ncbi:MAG TPA: cytochrome c maturation protein CcmE [Nitrospirae bacterium]|nr:cytochrome c maturation protein CcmE [Nitrospirota bacterium]
MSKSMNKAQKKFFVGASLLVLAIGLLIYSGVKASGTYYYTVSEVLSMSPGAKKAGLRLEGKVVPGSIKKDTENLKLDFAITDDSQKSMVVLWKGVTPDMFQDNIDVVVEGSVDQDGRFVASKLLTSCPSKYEAAKEAKESI